MASRAPLRTRWLWGGPPGKEQAGWESKGCEKDYDDGNQLDQHGMRERIEGSS